MKYESTYSNPAASLLQTASSHVCIACGQSHPACCGQCIRFVPEKVPCDYKCGHWVCNEGLAEYQAAERGIKIAATREA